MTWFARHRLAVAGLALVVTAAVAVGGYVLFGTPDYGERINGPSGDYPAPVGDGVPNPPLTVLGRADDPRILDGLGIELGHAVVARAVRSGAEYWSYDREGSTPSRIATADEGLYVLWDDGLLVRLDPRTAEPRWHTETGMDEYSEIRVVGSVVVLLQDTSVAAYHGDGGGEAWTASPPPDCRASEAFSDALVTGTALAIETSCTSGPDGVTVLDQDGRRTWIADEEARHVIRAGADRFGVTSSLGPVSIYDVDTGERAMRVARAADNATYWDGDDEFLVARNSDARAAGDVAYAAWDRERNQRAWSVRTDGTWQPAEIPLIAGDVVYAVHYRPDKVQRRALVAYDLATGEQRWHTEIDLARHVKAGAPVPFGELELAVTGISAGTVTLTIGEPGARTSDYCHRCSIVLGEA
ncbi:PQQ-binding-like beta-propeller repeat protein [Amycolatopsis cihanbeyliensis]|uniref:Putative pyrroloquinoline-quinone binding quinoprotein n=1 Tax=Amycolatopsis cihanbeyliensis TaxID=1128664 RepID=A0A542DLC1_AMYCI|nr:PQQ-binding-like beta-propeller repeat protein [Amycolatopsis cihanbeyliensis]TQJ03878.1 putative pyrroloquinoline-quinone binding quinoprotein [Amycolatopsis cihanbeyliensis]